MDNKAKKSGRHAKSEKTPFTGVFRKLVGTATHQEIADKIGTSRQNVGKWLSGTTSPDIMALGKIADAYNVSTDFLLGRTDVKTTDYDIKAVCDYLYISEQSAKNIRKIAQKGESLDPLLELYDIFLVVSYLNDIKRIATQKSYYLNVIMPIAYGDDTEGDLKNWYDDFYKNEVEICKYDCYIVPEERNCDNCSHKETDKDYVIKVIHKSFFELVENQLGAGFILDSREIQYDENSDIAEFRLNKQIAAIIEKIKNKATTDIASFEKYNIRIRNDLEEKLAELESYIVKWHNKGIFEKEERDKVEAKALKDFLETYDVNFHKKKEGVSNAHHNPPQE